MKGKYEVIQFVGVPLEMDDSGNYQIKLDNRGNYKTHDWRIGKHTKGKFQGIGQVFITENNLPVAIVKAIPLSFKERHAYTPMQRFTNQFIDEKVLNQINES